MKKFAAILFIIFLTAKLFAQPCGMSVILLSTYTAPCGQCASSIHVGVSGGTPPFSYQWNTGSTADSVYNICPGTYTCTVTDSAACVSSGTFTITSPAGPTVTATLADATCETCCDGMGMLSISGGTSPFSIAWSDNQTSDTASNLCPGKYVGCVTDANGCTSCDTIQVNYPMSVHELSQLSFEVFPNPLTNEMQLQFSETSPARVEIYSLTGEMIEAETVFSNEKVDVSALAAGTYLVKVRTENGTGCRRVVKLH